MKIAITGGGTGGHTVVSIAIADALKDYFKNKNSELDILYIGNKKGSENEFAKKKRNRI